MRTLVLTFLIAACSSAEADDRGSSPFVALKAARDAAKKRDWQAWAETMTPECQRVLVVDLNGFLITAADSARRAGVEEKQVEQFERELESAIDEWTLSGTVLSVVQNLAHELGRKEYRPSLVNADRLAEFARKMDLSIETSEDRLASRILLHTVEILAGKPWEKITYDEADKLDSVIPDVTLERLFEKAGQRIESRFEEFERTAPDFVAINLLSDEQKSRSQKCDVAEFYGPLAGMIPDVVRLCELIDVDCEPVLITAAGSAKEFVAERDSATAMLTVAEQSVTRELRFKRVDGQWRIDSLGYGRWLTARIQPAVQGKTGSSTRR